MIEPGSLDPWRDVAPHGLTAGFVRTWQPQSDGPDIPPHRAGLLHLALQDGVLRFTLPPEPADPTIDLTVRISGSARQQGTRWLQAAARKHERRGTLSPWQPLPRAAIPQCLRSWYGPGGAEATMSMLITPGGVVLECRGKAAKTHRLTEPLLVLLPFPADATERGLAWLEANHEALLL